MRDRQLVGDAHVTRRPLDAEVALSAEELVELLGVESQTGLELQRDHHLVTDIARRHCVDGHEDNAGEAADDALDWRGREVLTVDAQPVVVASGEVEPPVGVEVAEVARPIPAVASPQGFRFLVLVVALEARRHRSC